MFPAPRSLLRISAIARKEFTSGFESSIAAQGAKFKPVVGRQREDDHDHEQRRRRVVDPGRFSSGCGDILTPEEVAPSVDEHRLPEEPEQDEDDEADKDGPLVDGRLAQVVQLLPHHLLDPVIGLIRLALFPRHWKSFKSLNEQNFPHRFMTIEFFFKPTKPNLT